MPKKIGTDELLGIIEAAEKDTLGGYEGELSSQRAEAMKRYFGEPYGNEVEGRSTVISKDLADAVDWIMPSLLRVFLSTTDFLRFDPQGPDDEEAAEQETDFTNYVILKKNGGFVLLHDWFKDALLQKNGYVKHWWDETEEVTFETYGELTEDALAMTLMELEADGDEIEVVEQEAKETKVDGQPTIFFTIKVRRVRKIGKVCIMGVPPEELRISRKARGPIREAPFVQHRMLKTRSALIQMGLSPTFVADLPPWHEREETQERQARDQTDDEKNSDISESADRSTEEIEVKENYLRVDADGDGIAELRKVTVVGNKIPSGKDWNETIDAIPFSDLTPIRMPHRHIGRGMNDELDDIAQIKTALWRGVLDNTYLLNNVEWLVNERVNLDDFLTARPGGVKRVEGKEIVSGSAEPVAREAIIHHVIPVLDYVDGVKETRTGVGKNVTGLDPDTLKKTTEGAARQALQQANLKIEMIARLFAETGVKDLALAVHALLIKHQTKSERVKLRGKWVQINPQEWRKRTDMTVQVGIGIGSMEEVRTNLMLMGQIQMEAKQAGIVSSSNVYNLAEKMSDALGFKQQGMFFTDPKSPEGQQLQENLGKNPLVEAEKIKAEYKAQSDQLKQQFDAANKEREFMLQVWEAKVHAAIEILKAEVQAALKNKQIDVGAAGVGGEFEGNQPVGSPQVDANAAVQQMQQMMQTILEAVSKPRTIQIQRDADGRPVGAVSTPGE